MSAKLHHYLPQAYLTNFCNQENRLWVRDCKNKVNRRQATNGVAAITHYYSVEKDGKKDTAIEEFLSKIETEGIPIILDLEAQKAISDEQKGKLSVFLAMLWNRVPDFEKTVNKMHADIIKRTIGIIFSDEERVKHSLEMLEEKTGKSQELDAKQLMDFANRNEFDVKIDRIASLRMMLDLCGQIASYFYQMDWIIWHCPNTTSFVTSDNPLVLMPSLEVPWDGPYSPCGLAIRGCKKIVPLTQRCCLVMADKGDALVHGFLTRVKGGRKVRQWAVQ